MAKYFFEPSKSPILTGDTAHHLANVLRMKVGDSLILCDGNSTDYNAIIEYIKKNEIGFKILNSSPSLTEPEAFITLYQGIPKSDKLDLIVQKCVELGVSRIVPVETGRSVSKISGSKKIERLQKIALSAAEQSMRGIVPEVCEAVTFKNATKTANAIVAYENETSAMLKQVLPQATIDIWIGPEGGFTQDEITTLRNYGGKTVSLGPRILRTETAAIAALAGITLCLCSP